MTHPTIGTVAMGDTEALIRKAGQVAIDGIIDSWSDRATLPQDDDLADYLTRIVDACVRAALSTRPEQEPVAVPDGWQLVPIKADVGMIGAWYRYKNGHRFAGEEPARDTSDVGAWAALLAAAPVPPQRLTELDNMVASAIEAAIETSPEFNHGWRSMSDKELIPEILDEIPIEYTEKDVAEAIYRYKVRRLTGDAAPQPVLSHPEVKAGTYDIVSEQRWASALFEFMCDFGMIEVNFNGLTLERALEILRENYAYDEGHHSDDLAVDRFAAAMKAKLAEKRAQGYGGWDDPSDCTLEHLNDLLIKHIAKGDPIDVGNFAMMIHQRGGSIAR